MNFHWSDFKDIFYVFGSAAGVIALFRTVIESKLQRDLIRIDHVKSLINEQSLIDLEFEIYQARSVPSKRFEPLDQLKFEVRTKQDTVRFTGPLAKYLTKELNSLVDTYKKLRDFIQVNEWEPTSFTGNDGAIYTEWRFNREAPAFTKAGFSQGYAEHLDSAAEQAVQMKKAFNRFQLVSELHLFEAPIAKWLLKKRFKFFNLL